MIRRYAEMSPEQLTAAIGDVPLAIVTIGALEWHGPHLPLGLDGLVAGAFGERLAERTNGMLLPMLWTPITTLPHPASLDFDSAHLQPLFRQHFGQLGRAGFRAVLCISGHYAQGHMMCLYQAAIEAMEGSPDLAVLVASPLELLGVDDLLDHAARWETSQLLALRPELVHTDLLPESPTPKSAAVLGEDPRMGSAQEGARLLDQALELWAGWAGSLLKADGRSAAASFMSARMEGYAAYEAAFKPAGATWEDAIRTWWASK